jgi:hypothetical protein
MVCPGIASGLAGIIPDVRLAGLDRLIIGVALDARGVNLLKLLYRYE